MHIQNHTHTRKYMDNKKSTHLLYSNISLENNSLSSFPICKNFTQIPFQFPSVNKRINSSFLPANSRVDWVLGALAVSNSRRNTALLNSKLCRRQKSISLSFQRESQR